MEERGMDGLEDIIGLGKQAQELGVGEMAIRALIIYLVTLAIVRLGKKRFMGSGTAFDMIVGIMLGSMASRALTGNAPMIATMTAAAVLVFIHWLFSAIALQSGAFGTFIKGHSRTMIKNGEVDEAQLRKAHMTRRDLEEDLRSNGVADTGKVAEARLERNGQLSVVKAEGGPKILEVEVAAGVQRIRIELA
jgi:uncharacterized membrane protein YcaP (DUF421 family)